MDNGQQMYLLEAREVGPMAEEAAAELAFAQAEVDTTAIDTTGWPCRQRIALRG